MIRGLVILIFLLGGGNSITSFGLYLYSVFYEMIDDSFIFVKTTVTTDGICHQTSASVDSMTKVLQLGKNELF
jgi:hypothetical protein